MGHGKRETVVHTPDSGKNVRYIHDTGFLLLFSSSFFFFLFSFCFLLLVVGYWGFNRMFGI